jgi:hypothetical protein
VLAVLYAADELEAQARATVEEHARRCPACAATLENELRLRQAIVTHGEEMGDPDPLLLARCRHELSEALQELPAEGAASGWRSWISPDRWVAEFRRGLVLHPGWTAAALLLAGALGGTAAGTLYRATSLPLPGKPAMTVSAAPSLSDHELETMGIEGIHVKAQGDDSAPQVEVQLLSKKPMVVEGTPDDAEVRRVLTYVVEHGQKFDPGLRLDSLEVLRTRVDDPRVRAALCDVARRDDNPAVRLKALAALDGRGGDPAVQQTILGALAGDDNSGVRIEAINALLAAMNGGSEPSGMPVAPQALDVLRDRERNDSNSYVRMRSARVLSRLASYGDSGAGDGSSR